MAWAKRGRGRPKKDPAADKAEKDPRGNLMIELRTRSKVWVKCEPDEASTLVNAIHEAMTTRAPSVSLWPFSMGVLSVSDICSAQYFPAKVKAPKAPDEPGEEAPEVTS